MIGMTGAFGVAVAYGLIELFLRARSVLIIIGLALFVAAGLDSIVGWLVRHRMPRWAAVLTVIGCALAIVAAFLAAAIPPLASEATALAHQIPHYMHNLQDRNSQLGKLNVKYHIQQRLTSLVTGGGGSLIGGVLGAGALVLSTVSSIVAVAVLSIYFLAGLPSIKVFAYRLVPHSRRPRTILIGDEILAKVGGYVLGNFITSLIRGPWHLLLAARVRRPLSAPAGHLRSLPRPDPGDRIERRRGHRQPRRADGIPARRAGHPRVLQFGGAGATRTISSSRG